jgi:hypothetical protein
MGKVTVVGGGRASTPITADPVFANNDWATIIKVCQSGKVPDTWSVGDKKTMTIGSYDYNIDIIGKNHDIYSDGSGRAPLTFQLHEAYKDTGRMNPLVSGSSTNVGGWASCEMRNSTLPAILALMPTEVQMGIREVNKSTSAGGGSSAISTTADKLFLLSEVEFFGKTTYSFAGEGTQYAYYAAGNSTIKVYIYNQNAKAQLRERSPNKSDTTSFCHTNLDGTPHIDSAHSWFSISFAFCF